LLSPSLTLSSCNLGVESVHALHPVIIAEVAEALRGIATSPRLAGAIKVPAAKRSVAWDDVLRRTRAARTSAPLSAFVDTSVLVRHLTGDPPEMAARATDQV
jgi:hypothetical protein